MMQSPFVAVVFVAGVAASVSPVPTPSAAGVPEPPAWWSAAVREETARAIAGDLPSTSIAFRFQCSVAQFHKRPFDYVPPKCIRADAGLVSDPAVFAQRAAEEAALPVVTAQDRLRRAAWLRAIVLYSSSDATIKKFRTFVVKESIGAADLSSNKSTIGEVMSSDLNYIVPPHLEYSRAALHDGAQGTIKLTCRTERGAVLGCRTSETRIFEELQRPDGSLSFSARSYYFLLHDAHNAMQGVQVSPVTKSGVLVEGRDISASLSFRLK